MHWTCGLSINRVAKIQNYFFFSLFWTTTMVLDKSWQKATFLDAPIIMRCCCSICCLARCIIRAAAASFAEQTQYFSQDTSWPLPVTITAALQFLAVLSKRLKFLKNKLSRIKEQFHRIEQHWRRLSKQLHRFWAYFSQFEQDLSYHDLLFHQHFEQVWAWMDEWLSGTIYIRIQIVATCSKE